jgi:uncharacterized protein with HEPN domain
MPSDVLNALYDIRDNGKFVQAFVKGLSFEQFENDRKTFYAATRALEIISEASRRLSQDVRDAHPELPWRLIMGAGNVYRHNYDNVAERFIWHTVHHDIPILLKAIDEEIARHETSQS